MILDAQVFPNYMPHGDRSVVGQASIMGHVVPKHLEGRGSPSLPESNTSRLEENNQRAPRHEMFSVVSRMDVTPWTLNDDNSPAIAPVFLVELEPPRTNQDE